MSLERCTTDYDSHHSHFTQEGGELYYSDMYASKVVPDHMKQDAVLWGKTLIIT